MTIPRAEPVPSNVTRFLMLTELCRKLGEHGCSSYLVSSADGVAVLRIGRPGDPLGVTAMERSDGWVYAWEGRWSRAHDLDQLARHLARRVSVK